MPRFSTILFLKENSGLFGILKSAHCSIAPQTPITAFKSWLDGYSNLGLKGLFKDLCDRPIKLNESSLQIILKEVSIDEVTGKPVLEIAFPQNEYHSFSHGNCRLALTLPDKVELFADSTLSTLGIFELKTSAHESVQALSQVLGLDNPKYAQYSQAETMRISGFEGLPIVCSNPFQVCTLTSPSVGLCVPENFGVELSGCMKMLISTETGAKIIQKMSELLQNPSTVALMALREKPMVSPELKLIFTPAQMEYSPGELTLKINANDVVGQPYLGLIRTGEGFKITSETPADAITHLAGALGHEFLHVIHDLLPTDDVVFGTPKIGNVLTKQRKAIPSVGVELALFYVRPIFLKILVCRFVWFIERNQMRALIRKGILYLKFR